MGWDALLPFVNWLATTTLGNWLGQSTTRVAGLLTFHLFGLTLLLGATIIANLHLLGVLFREVPTRTLTRSAAPVMWIGLLLGLTSGTLTFVGGAQGYYESEWFRTKMELLAVALLFQFTLFQFVTTRAERLPAALRVVTGVFGLGIWFGVAFSGRAIAFF